MKIGGLITYAGVLVMISSFIIAFGSIFRYPSLFLIITGMIMVLGGGIYDDVETRREMVNWSEERQKLWREKQRYWNFYFDMGICLSSIFFIGVIMISIHQNQYSSILTIPMIIFVVFMGKIITDRRSDK